MEETSAQRCFGGVQSTFTHASTATGTDMTFAVYLPPQAQSRRVPALYYLAGLTCSPETGSIKAGAQRVAAELGLAVIFPDTSPRGLDLPGEHDDWDFGSAASFYIDATEGPWSKHYRMETYVAHELRQLVEAELPIDAHRVGISGHSMGGHGALSLALKYPEAYRSVSAFAPIVAPTEVPWGKKAFAGYLGPDSEAWRAHDTCQLISNTPTNHELLVDVGLSDPFLARELTPHRLEETCSAHGQSLTLRRHEGYDHSYWFVQSFMADHLRHHAERL